MSSEQTTLLQTNNASSFYNVKIISSSWIATYVVLDIILPLYNKILFNGIGDLKSFPFPLTASALQILGTFLIMASVSIIRHYIRLYRDPSIKDTSWILSPGLPRKIIEICIPGLLFAGLIGFSNIGLQKVGVNIHILLRASSVFWLLLGASLFKAERPHLIEVLCVLLVTAGVSLLSYSEISSHHASAGAIIINLISAMFSGIMAVAMRIVCVRVMAPPLSMSILDITAVKMMISALALLPLSVLLDAGLQSPSSFYTIFHEPVGTTFLLLGGVIITGGYQTTVVGVPAFLRATTVGVLHQSIILPQLLVFLAITAAIPAAWHLSTFDTQPIHITGSCFIVIGMLHYAAFRAFAASSSSREPSSKPISWFARRPKNTEDSQVLE